MKRYVGTKSINAEPMNLEGYNRLRGWNLPLDENGNDEGYLVEYTDGGKPNTEEYAGYISWSPKEQFEATYQLNGSFNFGHALEMLKEGYKVARTGWNGKGMFIFYVPSNKYPAGGNRNNTLGGMFEDDLVPYDSYIAMKTVQDTVVPWLASQTDLLAEDYCVVE